VSRAPETLEQLRLMLEREDEADDALRAICAALVERCGCAWAGIRFVERGELVLGPERGAPRPELRSEAPILFQGEQIAELAADGCPEPALLEELAPLLALYCLVGWDTGGVPWDESG
jgi:hypothetical protein